MFRRLLSMPITDSGFISVISFLTEIYNESGVMVNDLPNIFEF
ncbi:MAG: hypothetical protein QXY15_07240 [Candidatus Nitrosotenuis sp.]